MSSAGKGPETATPAATSSGPRPERERRADWRDALAGLPDLPGLTCGGVLQRIVQERAGDARATFTDEHAERALGTIAPLPEPGTVAARSVPGRFRATLGTPGLSLIAEVKRASPSQGHIAALDPATAARSYEEGGAAALSVLTEPRHFGGNREALQEVVAVTGLPALRKDFVVHPGMLLEAREWGASAALLMTSVLGEQLGVYLRLTRDLGLDALVEVHDEHELSIALASGADLIGVNNRDLTTLKIDLQNAPRLIRSARAQGFTGLLVAESGYREAADLSDVRSVADAVLVGSSLAGSGDLARAVRTLLA